ncbi:hypothetical protein Pelo_19142 [Pelomyxa schiedti]|nr:hypothetical protein Pelo_19142 [Pelomyxa schiedti]
MGRGPATALVGVLWSDWVRPTIRQFVLQVSGSSNGATTKSTTLWFAVSPLLLSLACGPDLAPPTIISGALADGIHVVQMDGGSLAIRNPFTYCITQLFQQSERVVINSHWAAMIRYSKGKGTATLLYVVKSSGSLPGGMEAFRGAVVVAMPFGSSACIYPDHSVESEVIVVHNVQNRATILAVDIEQTYNRRRLVVLSTTRFELPTGHKLLGLFVMRNWDRCSPGYGSRTFIFNTMQWTWCGADHGVFHVEESTGTSRRLQAYSETLESLSRVSDSVFCVSFCSKKRERSFNLFHCDNVAQPLQLPPRIKSLQAHANDSNTFELTAEYGFLFCLITSRFDVIDSTSGHSVLTINFPGKIAYYVCNSVRTHGSKCLAFPGGLPGICRWSQHPSAKPGA